jgi:hypothetical protein
MTRYIAVAALVICSTLTLACANPAANKTQANVASATQESTAKPADAETLAITPENSKVEFVAAKVTRKSQRFVQAVLGKALILSPTT